MRQPQVTRTTRQIIRDSWEVGGRAAVFLRAENDRQRYTDSDRERNVRHTAALAVRAPATR